jgi:hypothetical protein
MLIRVIKIESDDNRNQYQFAEDLKKEGFNSLTFKVKGNDLFVVAKP